MLISCTQNTLKYGSYPQKEKNHDLTFNKCWKWLPLKFKLLM